MNNKVKYVKDTLNEYLMREEYICVSDIELFLKSPRIYFYNKNKSLPPEKQDPFFIHIALYEYVKNRELFNFNFIVSPKFNKRTTQGKTDHNEFVEKNKEKTVITEDEMQFIEQASVSVMMNPTFMQILEGSQHELSVYTVDKKTGLNVKLRPHVVSEDKNIIIEVMGCLDCSPIRFRRDIEENGSLHAALFLDFLNKGKYVFGAIEKNPPYQAVLYSLSNKIIEQGRSQYRMALDLMKWSMENNYWCDYIEFEFLKEHYLKGKLEKFTPQNEKTELIKII
jgi:hypothetical protein